MINSDAIPYERLPGRGRRTGVFQIVNTSCTLWLAPDHLLSVETNGYTESYRRYYFKDIQAIQLCPTTIHLSVMGAVILLLLLTTPFFFIAGLGTGAVMALAWVAVWGILLAVYLSKGPTCRAMIRTAVQTDQLPALSRVKQARQILNRIAPLIEAAQGGRLGPEEALARLGEYQRRALQISFSPAPGAMGQPGGMGTPYQVQPQAPYQPQPQPQPQYQYQPQAPYQPQAQPQTQPQPRPWPQSPDGQAPPASSPDSSNPRPPESSS